MNEAQVVEGMALIADDQAKWSEDGLVGLAFTNPVMLDRSSDPTN